MICGRFETCPAFETCFLWREVCFAQDRSTAAKEDSMLLTTTSTLEGMRINRYIGIVSGEAIMGANIFRDFFAGIRDVVGGRSGAYEKELRKAKDIAIQEMVAQATHYGANAVIGIDLDYETIQVGDSGGMLMVTASGTAIVVDS
jgi:uncharacterized protein YbjQ (UPF0145 family)